MEGSQIITLILARIKENDFLKYSSIEGQYIKLVFIK